METIQSKINKIESLINECKKYKIDCKNIQCEQCPFNHEIGSENLFELLKSEFCGIVNKNI